MYIHNLNPILINFGFFEVRWYSLAYILGILVGWWIAKKIIAFKVKNETIFFDANLFDDLMFFNNQSIKKVTFSQSAPSPRHPSIKQM